MWFRSLGQEDPLEEEEGMATTPLFLPGESHRQEEASGLQSMGSQLDMTEAASQARTT